MKFAISCLGCKVNTYEAESISQSFLDRGYTEVDFKELADIYIIVTCVVTNVATGKSRKKINQAIRQNSEAIICVVGCYAQTSSEELMNNDKIHVVVGSMNKGKIVDYIDEVVKNKKQVVSLEDVRGNVFFEDLPIKPFLHQTRGVLKIQDGCNQFCGYCIIPYARGKERSLDPNKVIEKIAMLSKHHQEIVLSGIHTGRYGKEYGITLSQLLVRIFKETDVARLRISSIEISEIDDDFIALLEKEPRLAKHLHIPLQSGCDSVLKRMNRPYSTDDYYQRLCYIRTRIPTISISTDIMVGFCGETEEEFNTTKQFLKKCELSFYHVFPFSLKKGTAAEKMKQDVNSDVKKERVRQLLNQSKEENNQFLYQFLNKTMSVLIESYDNNQSIGYSSEYNQVIINEKIEINTIVSCRCIAIEDEHLIAERG